MILDEAEQQELKKYTYSVYILQALCFVTLITGILGLIVNYIKQDDVLEADRIEEVARTLD